MRVRILALGAILLLAAAATAIAAPSPFGISTPDTGGGAFGGPLAPVFAWIAARQAEFYRGLTGTLGAMKESGSAAWLLLGLSFLYGIFHAAGPGHGKAVITSYVLASGETAKRGVAISFAAALVQAVTAIVVVGIAAAVLNVTARSMTAATDWLEIGSYGLIVILGVWLLWSRGFAGGHHHHHFVPAAAGAGGAALHDHHHGRHHDAHRQDHHDNDHHGHTHHRHGPGCGHTRAAAVAAADLPRNPLAKAWSAILGVGIRPCSGAIIVLVFALSQGLFLAGIAATFAMALGTGITVAALAAIAVSAKGFAVRMAGEESAFAHVLHRAIEIGGALVVLLLGLLLLGGALSTKLG